jgi:hypothetical protein
VSRRYPADLAWDYWAKTTSEGQRKRWALGSVPGRPAEYDQAFSAACERPVNSRIGRNGLPAPLPYRWRQGDQEREAWAATMVDVARRRARDLIAWEIVAGRRWVPRRFTVADLDALIAEVYQ